MKLTEKIKRQIPNGITLLNMVFGCLAMAMAAAGKWEVAAWYIYAAAGMDFLDGLAARALKVASPIGKDLDSLSDVVSFGVAPAALFYAYFRNSTGELCACQPLYWIPVSFLLIPVLSAYRLAKFNHDVRQGDRFFGLPTPAFGLFNASLIAAAERLPDTWLIWILPAAAIMGSILLVSDLPLLALKIKNTAWRGNEIRYILVAGSAGLILTLGDLGISLAIIFYIFLSIFAARNEVHS